MDQELQKLFLNYKIQSCAESFLHIYYFGRSTGFVDNCLHPSLLSSQTSQNHLPQMDEKYCSVRNHAKQHVPAS